MANSADGQGKVEVQQEEQAETGQEKSMSQQEIILNKMT